ncbi:hypothetical protein [Aquifex aeolicus]|nr:hypothetical protein [Aquifex aeolicus]
MGIKLTEEQKEIIKAFKNEERMKINAYAGTPIYLFSYTLILAVSNKQHS